LVSTAHHRGAPATSVSAEPAATQDGQPLELVRALAHGLDEAKVPYCHFKSNEAIGKSLRGENDLDLLIGFDAWGRFLSVLSRLGFKEGVPHRVRRIPAVAQFYGLDTATGRLVQVHAHRRLVFGDDMTKNFVLDVEDRYIAAATRDLGPLPVASPEFELLLFAFRMVAKHCTPDAIAMLQGRLSASERRELIWLIERADLDHVASIVGSDLPFVGRDLFTRCIEAIGPTAGPWRKVRTAGALHRAFAAHRRRSRPVDAFLRVERRVGRVARRIVRGKSRKRPVAGGALIAFVGGDGAGKSTAVADVTGWLGGTFDVRRIHLGKPPPSLVTVVVKGPMFVLRTLGMFRSTLVPSHVLREDHGSHPGLPWIVWHVLTARDRLRLYRDATASVLRGTIVISDRFPLPEVQTMDAAKTAWLAEHPRSGRLARWLIDLERRSYAAFMPPDVLVVLRVDPAVAVERKRHEEEPGFVRPRSEEIWRADWSGTSATVVDSGHDLEEVRRTLRSLVWTGL
jgi:thymidylate kinase